MMDPVIFDSASPWSNLWLVSSALYVLVWAVFIAASLFVRQQCHTWSSGPSLALVLPVGVSEAPVSWW